METFIAGNLEGLIAQIEKYSCCKYFNAGSSEIPIFVRLKHKNIYHEKKTVAYK